MFVLSPDTNWATFEDAVGSLNSSTSLAVIQNRLMKASSKGLKVLFSRIVNLAPVIASLFTPE